MGIDWEEILGDGDLDELYNDLIPLPDELDELDEPDCQYTVRVHFSGIPQCPAESNTEGDPAQVADYPFYVPDPEECPDEDDGNALPFDD